MIAAKKVCLLVSGGLDSAALLAELLSRGREVHPLYVRCGMVWEEAELFWLRRQLRALAGPRLRPLCVVQAPMAPLLAPHWSLTGRRVPPAGSPWDSVHLPGRNLLLLSEAGILCWRRGLRTIALAVLKGNPFLDARPAFFKAMEAALRESLGVRLSVTAPYRLLSKREVGRRVPALPWALTFSCLKPRGLRPCGGCSKCEERSLLGPAAQ